MLSLYKLYNQGELPTKSLASSPAHTYKQWHLVFGLFVWLVWCFVVALFCFVSLLNCNVSFIVLAEKQSFAILEKHIQS